MTIAKKLYIPLVLLLAVSMLLSSCGSGDKKDAADEYGVGELAWGEKADGLFTGDNAGSIRVVQYGAEYAGYTGSLYYGFDADGGMNAAYYEFNQNGALDPIETYRGLLEALTAEFGEREEMLLNDGNGNTVPAPTIDDAASTGEMNCIDMWNSVPAPEGSTVTATLQLYPDGKITLTFYKT